MKFEIQINICFNVYVIVFHLRVLFLEYMNKFLLLYFLNSLFWIYWFSIFQRYSNSVKKTIITLNACFCLCFKVFYFCSSFVLWQRISIRKSCWWFFRILKRSEFFFLFWKSDFGLLGFCACAHDNGIISSPIR